MVYGLDIETDTTVDGLDPAVAPIVTVALSNDGSDEVFTGPEHYTGPAPQLSRTRTTHVVGHFGAWTIARS